MICSICGQDKPDEELEDGICLNCLSSIVSTDGMSPDEDDFKCN